MNVVQNVHNNTMLFFHCAQNASNAGVHGEPLNLGRKKEKPQLLLTSDN